MSVVKSCVIKRDRELSSLEREREREREVPEPKLKIIHQINIEHGPQQLYWERGALWCVLV
jgi:hypothetical protein